MARPMTRRNAALVLFLAASLAACASSAPGTYPPLEIGNRGARVSGTFEPAFADTPELPDSRPTEAGDLAQLLAEAQFSHEEFLAEAAARRRTIEGGRGMAMDSDSWAQAQVALASLESARSRTLVTLANLDRIYVDAELAQRPTEEIESARRTVAGLVDSENRLIEEFFTGLH